MPHISHHIRNTTIIHPLEENPGASAERADRADGNFEKRKPSTKTPMHLCPLRRGSKNSLKMRPGGNKRKESQRGKRYQRTATTTQENRSISRIQDQNNCFCHLMRCSQRESTWCCAAWHSPGPHLISDRCMSQSSHRGTAR